jgi:microcystin-dependent protein
MPAPIKPSEICALVPSGTSSLCQRMLDVFLKLPAKICAWATWMFNEDGTLSDAFKDEAQIIPTGTVIYRLSTVVPTGWLAANGQEVSRMTYALLFSILGTNYGVGNGTTTFNLPNLQDRFLYGKGSTSQVGDTGGEAEHVLTVPELPAHGHPAKNGGYILSNPSFAGDAATVEQEQVGPPDGSYSGKNVTTGDAGNDVAHNTLPPYLRAVALIKS